MVQPFLFFLLFTVCVNVKTDNPSVIIVGAGPSGIAAAAKLLQNSITNITILEAENRIGGRVHTVEFGGGHVDLGAEYCHGEKGNVVYELAKDLNVLEHSNPSHPTKIFDSTGSTLDSNIEKDLISVILSYDDDLNVTDDASLAEAFMEKYNSTFINKYSNDPSKLKIATDALWMIESLTNAHEGSFNWQQPAAGRHYLACEGDQGMTWKTGGYNTILKILLKSYPNSSDKLPIDNKLHLNKKVKKINWSSNQVVVKCEDNSSLTADHVIFTPSIGVLRYLFHTLFDPELPPVKTEVVKAIGFSGIMKIVLHFPKVWWEENGGFFFFLWNSEDLTNIDFKDGPKQDDVSWVAFLPAVTTVPGAPNALILWVTGDLVPEIEKTSDDVLLRGCNYVLKKFLGKSYDVTEADQIIRSQWVTNKNFLGTYSYEKVGFFKEDVSYQRKLSEPLSDSEGKPRVLFAGEATHPTLYSTVHGAISSGMREAERIINLYK